MKAQSVAQLSSVLLAVCTPWLVSWTALRVATATPASLTPHVQSMALLRAVTVVAAVTATIATALAAPSPWMLLVAGLGFAAPAVVALKVLGEIDDLTRPARQVSAAERAASLRPRRPGEYLPWSWRLTSAGLAVLGAAAFVVRVSSGGTGRRVFIPGMFAVGAVIFLWLYEVWAHQVITGPIVADDEHDLHRIVGRIFAMELVLVVVCLGAAHALLNLNWSSNGTLGAAIALGSGVVGVVGCALALSSELVGRRYATATHPGSSPSSS
jgi:hypothetical protein